MGLGFGVWVWRLTFGDWRLAFGVWGLGLAWGVGGLGLRASSLKTGLRHAPCQVLPVPEFPPRCDLVFSGTEDSRASHQTLNRVVAEVTNARGTEIPPRYHR